jgi:hypothetical protein
VVPTRSRQHTSDEEFSDLEDGVETINRTPVKECLEILQRSLVPESEKEVLNQSFGMFVQFAFEISRRVEVLVEKHCEGESPFFQWVFEGLLEGAKVLKGRGVVPERKTLSTIMAIGSLMRFLRFL